MLQTLTDTSQPWESVDDRIQQEIEVCYAEVERLKATTTEPSEETDSTWLPVDKLTRGTRGSAAARRAKGKNESRRVVDLSRISPKARKYLQAQYPGKERFYVDELTAHERKLIRFHYRRDRRLGAIAKAERHKARCTRQEPFVMEDDDDAIDAIELIPRDEQSLHDDADDANDVVMDVDDHQHSCWEGLPELLAELTPSCADLLECGCTLKEALELFGCDPEQYTELMGFRVFKPRGETYA